MADATPLEAATDLFNKLALLNPNDQEQALQYAFRLASLDKQLPGNWITKIAYAETLLLCGRRDEALIQIDTAYALREESDFAAVSRLIMLLFHTAQVDRARELINRITFKPAVRANPVAIANAAFFALWSGDVALLERAHSVEKEINHEHTAGTYIAVLSASSMLKHIENHQRIVIDCVRSNQVWVGANVDFEGGTPPMINVEHYVVGDSNSIRMQRRELFEALRSYYLDQGESPAAYLPYFTNSLVAVPQQALMAVA